MSQNAMRLQWTTEEVDNKLKVTCLHLAPSLHINVVDGRVVQSKHAGHTHACRSNLCLFLCCMLCAFTHCIYACCHPSWWVLHTLADGFTYLHNQFCGQLVSCPGTLPPVPLSPQVLCGPHVHLASSQEQNFGASACHCLISL